jgi:hypothetical protein
VTQPTLQPTSATNPPTCGRLALQLEIDDLWQQTRSPKIGLFAMRAIYGRLAELRAQLTTLENTPNGN